MCIFLLGIIVTGRFFKNRQDEQDLQDGQVMREQKFGHTQGYTLQMLVSGNQIVEVQLIDEVVFRSNYNQMFLLGRYRKDLYEETYNAFPFSRLFRVKYQ